MASHLIGGNWIDGEGSALETLNPSDGAIAWRGREASSAEVDRAIASARAGQPDWSALGFARRADLLKRFAERVKARRDELVHAISLSTGKPLWESRTEVDAMVNKVSISIDIESKRIATLGTEAAGVRSATRFKPHGVCAVIGPFNFPGHLPNGHVVPALLAGNTIVYKPSELTPLVAEIHAKLLGEAGLPNGVFNLLQGGASVGRALTEHADLDGIFFTGSRRVGVAIAKANVERTGRILALEMGGNNPLIVHRAADLKAVAYAIIQSAFITAGQRCSCARRLVLVEDEAGAILDALKAMTESICVGRFDASPEPFIGPVISTRIAERALQKQEELLAAGGESIVRMRAVGPRPNFLSPGIVDVTNSVRDASSDDELFAPLLEVIRVKSFDAAIVEANDTRYGLAAGLISDERSLWERFFREIRAGIVNWNRPTTGASSALPFGGIGDSGNHRPSAASAAEYCSYPIATMESDRVTLPATILPGIGI